jgi:C4-dicarboxylate-specific signal transduction histidine kinase
VIFQVGHLQRGQFWRSATVCLSGGLVIALLSYAFFLLGAHFATAGFCLIIVLSLLSLGGRFFDSLVLSVVAIGCLDFFFIPPIFSLEVGSRMDILPMAAFLTTSLIITGLTAKIRRAAAEELRQTRTALARFARVAALGELTASIAHEVNQPLAGVVSSGNACLRWLASQPPDIDRASQSVNRIIRDANRASEVVRRVRSLITNAPPQKTWLNINEAVQEITVLLRREIEDNRIVLTVRLSDDIPPIWADRIQLQQVFMNLVGNAIDALKPVTEGSRELFVSTDQDGAGGVLATVRDSGTGLDPAKLRDIFDAFYTTKSEGIGMGLAICRSIVESHHGRLWATPNHPRGAIFQLALPIDHQEVV